MLVSIIAIKINQEGFSVRSRCSSQLLWWFQKLARRDTVHRRNLETCRTLNPIKTEIFSISTGAYHDRKSTSACQPSHKIQARNNSVNYHTKGYKRLQKKDNSCAHFSFKMGTCPESVCKDPAAAALLTTKAPTEYKYEFLGPLICFFSTVKMGGFCYPRGLKGLNLEHRREKIPL